MYEEFYNFTGKPFQLTPDQKFYFNSRVHKRAMSYLQYGLEQKEGFIVITGPVGSGKTMLVRNLFGELDQKNVMAAQLVTTQVDPEDMLRMVCASFGLPNEGLNKAAMLQNLESVAASRYAEGKRVLLVVDEAQNLPARSIEELRMLSNFQVDGNSLFQSFLLGQEEFKRTLAQPGMEQVRQRIIASSHLEPLDLTETQNYVEFRLSQVGWKGDPDFDPETFAGIHKYSGGIPRKINTLCDRLLLFSCLEELHVVDRDALEAVASEMGSEVGRTQPAAARAEPHPEVDKIDANADAMYRDIAGLETAAEPEPPTEAPPPVQPQVPAFDPEVEKRLTARIENLEEALEKLRKSVQQDRKMLKKAVLMQLNLDDDDD